MFKILRAIGSGGVPYLMIVKLLAIFALFASISFGYNYVSGKFEELSQAKELIKKQNTAIDNLQLEIIKLQESNQATLTALKEMVDKKQEVKQIIKEKIVVVTEKVNDIKKDVTQTDDIKEIAISSVYIDDIYKTYCAVNKINCEENSKL